MRGWDAFELSPLTESLTRGILLFLIAFGERGSRQSSTQRQLWFFSPYRLNPECRSPAARPEEQDAASSPVSCQECPFTPEQTVSEYRGCRLSPHCPEDHRSNPTGFRLHVPHTAALCPPPLPALLCSDSAGGFEFWMCPGCAGGVSPQTEQPLHCPFPSSCSRCALTCQFGIPIWAQLPALNEDPYVTAGVGSWGGVPGAATVAGRCWDERRKLSHLFQAQV